MFVLKKVSKQSIASLHRLTQDMQRANLRRTSGTLLKFGFKNEAKISYFQANFELYYEFLFGFYK